MRVTRFLPLFSEPARLDPRHRRRDTDRGGDGDPALARQMRSYLVLARRSASNLPLRASWRWAGCKRLGQDHPRRGARSADRPPPGARILESDRAQALARVSLRKRRSANRLIRRRLRRRSMPKMAAHAPQAFCRAAAASYWKPFMPARKTAMPAAPSREEAGCPFHGFWLDVDPAALEARIAGGARVPPTRHVPCWSPRSPPAPPR